MAPDPAAITSNSSISAAFGDIGREIIGAFEALGWAEDEIDAARTRHPDAADTLWHSFALLPPRQELMSTEFVYRSHAVEILERVVAGQDTRPATAAEVCCVLAQASQVTPLASVASGLYCRMWRRAFPDQPLFWESHDAHEALEGARIDELDTITRRKAGNPERVLGEITCAGWHHGVPADCRYAAGQRPLSA
ncbi:hypothetical protein [Saccharopolyspora sp. 6V]|uniref:hypothetical protein n=1 Tax=Saccharopolyspora sp. 6V TaxID=2877239 RepID=UPI001CD2A7F7|nr:hypothetical protein [Saccharopolyspora sp. 6V]MCA1196247.1 hypothetical protein [Saccharopolyspora sp. 6V]